MKKFSHSGKFVVPQVEVSQHQIKCFNFLCPIDDLVLPKKRVRWAESLQYIINSKSCIFHTTPQNFTFANGFPAKKLYMYMLQR